MVPARVTSPTVMANFQFPLIVFGLPGVTVSITGPRLQSSRGGGRIVRFRVRKADRSVEPRQCPYFSGSASARSAHQSDVRVFRREEYLSTTSCVLTPAASADLTGGRDASAVASWGDRFPMDPLAWNVPTLSRIKHTSSQVRRDATRLCLRQFYALGARLWEKWLSCATSSCKHARTGHLFHAVSRI